MTQVFSKVPKCRPLAGGRPFGLIRPATSIIAITSAASSVSCHRAPGRDPARGMRQTHVGGVRHGRHHERSLAPGLVWNVTHPVLACLWGSLWKQQVLCL
jgi:hypothetical protein